MRFRLHRVCELVAVRLTRWRSDDRGATAIEFGMVAVPFFLFAFAIMGVGLQFFTINALEHGVESAARQIRVGIMQKGYESSGSHVDYTLDDFRDLVCSESGSYIQCDENLVIHIKSDDEWVSGLVTPCMTGGSLTPATGNSSDAVTTKTGGAGRVVVVTACYEWSLGGDLWQVLWNLLVTGAWGTGTAAKTADKIVIQSLATFRVEPYE